MGNKVNYSSWPIGKLPKEWQRPELDKVREAGYVWNDARDIIDIFEKKVAEFAGSKYAVSVDCCSHGLFLCLKYAGFGAGTTITIPKNTYVSVPMQIIHAGFHVKFEEREWRGVYRLSPLKIYDGAVRWKRGMYVGDNALQVVSFQIKKRIPIGRGGMILTDSKDAYERLKLMSYDGRDLNLPYDHPEHIKCMGYHFYMTPEDAARGILLMDQVPEDNEDTGDWTKYTDVSVHQFEPIRTEVM